VGDPFPQFSLLREPLWLRNPNWAETVKLGKGDNAGTARERFGDAYDWVRKWTIYADVLGECLHTGGGTGKTEADQPTLENVGAPSRLIHQMIDTSRFGVGRTLGLRLLQDVFLPVLNEQFEATRTGEPALRDPISAWYAAVTRNAVTYIKFWQQATGDSSKDPDRKIRSLLWRGGVFDERSAAAMPVSAAAGLRQLTEQIDKLIAPMLRVGEVPTARPGGFSVDDYLDLLLPPDLSERVKNNAERLKVARRQAAEAGANVDDLGIDANGHTELMTKALPQIVRRIPNGESMLVLGPTSSGKSHVGRIAVAYALAQPTVARAVVLLPTKALVTQALAEWNEFTEGTPHEGWRVLAGSRDYPDNDEALIRGDFEIAILIPEKLTALMANGMKLVGCGVLVVDELQHLADRTRGPRLEMLLTSIRAEYTALPILGLSATLTRDSSEAVRRWLDIADDSAVVQATKRPVPLDEHVCDDRRVLGHTAEGAPINDTLVLWDRLRTWRANDLVRAALSRIHTYDRSVALAVELLREGHRSVLCFVGSRDDAEYAARAATAVMAANTAAFRPVRATETNVFRGRFADVLTADEAERRRRHFERFPDTDVKTLVGESLLAGVGFHTARLEQSMRDVIEQAFRDGVIRLLFATDTLKLGLNLPAEAVIVGSMTTPSGLRQRRVLSRDDAAQRLGRAGRLGFSARGRGYLVVSDQLPPLGTLHFEPADLDGLAELEGAVTDHEAPLDRAYRALRSVDAVYDHYLVNKPTDVGTAITTSLSPDWFARLLMQAIVGRSRSFTRDDLEHRVDQLFQVSMGGKSGGTPPDASEVLDVLLNCRLVGDSIREPGQLTITGLGRAINASGLPFEDAAVVERVAKAAAEGAGSFTLLAIAVTSAQVRSSTGWISLQPPEGNAPAEDTMKQRTLAVARVFTAPAEARASVAARLRSGDFYRWLDLAVDEDLVGEGSEADALRAFIEDPGPDPGLPEFNHVLRACVLTLWMYGCPLGDIRAAITPNVRVDGHAKQGKEALRREVTVHDADVRSIAETTSYVFDAAGELLGVRPEGMAFRRTQAIGDALQFGVPQVLAPLARLNLPATHRERIAYLVPCLRRGFDTLPELVDRYLCMPAERPQTAELRRRARNSRLLDSERALVKLKLEELETRQRGRSGFFPPAFRGKRVPGLGQAFGPIVDQLSSPDAVDPLDQLARVLAACGVTTTVMRDGLQLTSRVDAAVSARLVVSAERVDVERLAELRFDARLVVALGGVTTGASTVDLRHRQVSDLPIVVEPPVLLEAIVRVLIVEAPELMHRDHSDLVAPTTSGSGDERSADARFSVLLEDPMPADPTPHGVGVSDEEDEEWLYDEPPDDDQWDVDPNDLESLGSGMDVVGDKLLKILLAAPPVLRRADLNRLIAGLSVAAPPPLS
jgi:superfamily II DNA/RNA helicase